MELPLSAIETPCLIYDLRKIDEQMEKLERGKPSNVRIFYAMKANPHEQILGRIKNAGYGVETTSTGEMRLALERGFSPKEILLTGPGKNESTLQYAMNNNVGTIIVESVREAERVDVLSSYKGKKQGILVRLSPKETVPGDDLKDGFALFGGKPVKYGIDEEVMASSIYRIRSLTHLDFRGIHVFAASGVQDYASLIHHVESIFRLMTILDDIEIVDFGGGFGVSHDKRYEFDINSYYSSLRSLISEFNLDGKKLFLELGTYLVATCGTYIATIIDVKESRGQNFLILDGGIHHLLRPALVSNHALSVYDSANALLEDGVCCSVQIVGNLCHPLDTLAKDVVIPIHNADLEGLVGGKVAIHNCGAYGYNFSITGFSLHDAPSVYIVDNDENLRRWES